MVMLSKRDLDEVEKFRQYLGDLHSKMPRKAFVSKWRNYMGLNEMASEAYLKSIVKPLRVSQEH